MNKLKENGSQMMLISRKVLIFALQVKKDRQSIGELKSK